jgi:hypothetical protein
MIEAVAEICVFMSILTAVAVVVYTMGDMRR